MALRSGTVRYFYTLRSATATKGETKRPDLYSDSARTSYTECAQFESRPGNAIVAYMRNEKTQIADIGRPYRHL
jgi:hypothetical protein